MSTFLQEDKGNRITVNSETYRTYLASEEMTCFTESFLSNATFLMMNCKKVV